MSETERKRERENRVIPSTHLKMAGGRWHLGWHAAAVEIGPRFLHGGGESIFNYKSLFKIYDI